MPSLIDMRRRIRAVKSTQQITKAMKMVAASKLRRAQDRVIAARPFAREARRVLASIASRVEDKVHPLLLPGTAGAPTLLIVIAADRGLCGSFNTNVVKAVGQYLREHPREHVTLGLVGRKSREMLGRRGLPVRFEYVNLPRVIHFADAEAIAAPAIADFVGGKLESVQLVYNEFKSVMQQRVVDRAPAAASGDPAGRAGDDRGIVGAARGGLSVRAVGRPDLRGPARGNWCSRRSCARWSSRPPRSTPRR